MSEGKRRIRIHVGESVAVADLLDTPTAEAIWERLPFRAPYNVWGDEIYFEAPLDAPESNLHETVDVGDIAFWSPGRAFCIFYGKTPASQGDEIRPASAVSVFGRIEGDATILRDADGPSIRIERMDET